MKRDSGSLSVPSRYHQPSFEISGRIAQGPEGNAIHLDRLELSGGRYSDAIACKNQRNQHRKRRGATNNIGGRACGSNKLFDLGLLAKTRIGPT